MRGYAVKGIDQETGAHVVLNLREQDEVKAARLAESRGVTVESVESDRGSTYLPDGAGGLRYLSGLAPDAPRAGKADGPLIALSFLIPIVGVIAGSMRLAHRDSSGAGVIGASILGGILWVLILVSMGG